MGLGYNGSAMIRHQKDAPPGELFEPRQYGPDDLFVEILYSLDLQIQLAGMRSFVRSFDVDKYEIFLLERIQGALDLSLVIGVNVAGGAGNFNNLETGIFAYAAHEVHSGYDRACYAEPISEG